MRHASLFSGIGGAEIAAAWLGWENLFHCDINEFGRKVLGYWFPKSKEYNDIKTTDFTEWRGRVDILTAGFPCQPFSMAGKRRGADDDRYLWPETLRAINEIRPAWFVGENVFGIASWYSPARRLTWAAQTIFSTREIYTERSGDSSSTASAGTSRTRDIPSSRLLYRLVPSERRTGGTGCGLWRGGKMSDMMLKTPTAMDAVIGSPKSEPKSEPKSGDSGCLAQEIVGGYAVILPTPTAMDSTEATARMKLSQTKDGSMHSVTLARAVHTLLPTPLAVSVRHSKRVSAAKAQGSVSFRSRLNGEEAPTGLEDWLEFNGLMPSPVSQDYRRRGPNSRQQGLPELCHKLMHTPIADGLKKRTKKGQKRMTERDFAEFFPTPVAMDATEATARMSSSQVKEGSMHSVTLARAVQSKSQDSKDGRASQLNPLFVGEMMGYPLEWLTSPFLSGNGGRRP